MVNVLSLGLASVKSHAHTRTNINARQIAVHNLIHCLPRPSSHPSPPHLPLTSLTRSFFLSHAPLFCPFFSLRVVNENNGQIFKYLWVVLGSISKDCHLQGNGLLAAFPTLIHLFSIWFSLRLSFIEYIAIIPITIYTVFLFCFSLSCHVCVVKYDHWPWIFHLHSVVSSSSAETGASPINSACLLNKPAQL